MERQPELIKIHRQVLFCSSGLCPKCTQEELLSLDFFFFLNIVMFREGRKAPFPALPTGEKVTQP